MSAERSGRLRLDGASLYYAVRGSGPPVVLLPSGGGDAHCADRLVAHLARSTTVLTFDRRGQTRTALDEPRRRVPVERHADDAVALAEHVFGEPVAMFGCSTGAVIGLDVARRRPSHLSMLVAHEPPLWSLATEAERAHHDRSHREIRRLHKEQGWQEALKVMRMAFDGTLHDPLDHDAESAWEPPNWRTIANLHAFFTAEVEVTWAYRIDGAGWDAIRTGSTRVVPAAGGDSGAFPRRCAEALAGALGERLIELPGGHQGYRTQPTAFSKALLALLGHAQPPAADGTAL